jgi:hypothetical protein
MNRFQLHHTLIWFSSILLLSMAFAQPNFVAPGNAEVLLVTHSNLRTPNWVPGHPEAWETMLLEQKTLQGLDVAIVEVSDGQVQSQIKQSILGNLGTATFLYIIGDAKRPAPNNDCERNNGIPGTWLDANASEPSVPPANFAAGNIVPNWYDVETLDLLWGFYSDGRDWRATDHGYVDYNDNIRIGRLPASTQQEILDYLGKCGQYLSLSASPAWSTRMLWANDNGNFGCNGTPGEWTYRWENAWHDHVPSTTPITVMHSTDYIGSAESSYRTAINNGYGVVTSFGPCGAANQLTRFYFGSSSYEGFANIGMYPLLIAASCDQGGFDQFTYPMSGDVPLCSVPITEIPCVVEKLLLLPQAGIIGAIAPTGATTGMADGLFVYHFFEGIYNRSITNFGHLLRHAQIASRPWFDKEAFTYGRFILLGDPTLSLPYQPFARGRWTAASSPIRVTQSLSIPEGGSLTIEAGTTVIFSPGVSLTVLAGASLIAAGTAQAPIHLQGTGSTPQEAWRGIFFHSNSSQNLLDHCVLDNATVGGRGMAGSSAVVRNSTFNNCGIAVSTNNGGQLSVQSCTIAGSRYYGAVAAGRSILNFTGGSITDSKRAGIWSAGIAYVSMNGTSLSGNGLTADQLAARVMIMRLLLCALLLLAVLLSFSENRRARSLFLVLSISNANGQTGQLEKRISLLNRKLRKLLFLYLAKIRLTF